MTEPARHRVVWKYPLELNQGTTTHQIPVAARLVHAALQYGVPTLWFEVDPDATKTPRTLIGTGGDAIDGEAMTHVGSFLLADGALVLHAYEVLRP